MRKLLLTLALLGAYSTAARAAFSGADITELVQERDEGGTVIAIRASVTLHDDATTETTSFTYRIAGAEFSQLPPAGQPAQRRAAVIRILKREARRVFDIWVRDRQARVATVDVRDPVADLGVAALTNTDTANPVP